MLLGYALRVFCTIFTCTPIGLGQCSSAPIVPDIPRDPPSPNSIDYLDEHQKDQFLLSPRSRGHEQEEEETYGGGSYVEQEANPTVWIQDGGLTGFRMRTLSGRSFAAFQNVPFAQPPVGPLRFRAPIKNSGWKGIREAIRPAPTCLQTDFFKLYNVSGQEDCLYLNVYTTKIPNHSEELKLPVMVFIHGGAFYFGSSNLYGPTYMMEESIVLVSINYRLGPFGFLSTGDDVSPGNNGLKDQALALEWVRDNIQAFGGDPNRVTIFGESAGAGSVQFHMISPLSRGLFHGGISESGCAFCFWSINEKGKEMSSNLAKMYNCNRDNSSEMVECLRRVDGKTLVQGQLAFLEWGMYPFVLFGPVIEPKHAGAFLDDLPANIYARGESAQVPWIAGFNAEEGASSIAMLVDSPTTLAEVNGEWDRVGPVLLGLGGATADPPGTARTIRNFYLGDRNVSYETRQDAIKMFSDRYMVTCILKSIQYHAKLSQKPVYAYRFNYRGPRGMVNLIGQETEDWGIAHIDELIYLMNNTAYYPPLLRASEEEYTFSRLIVNVWVNFARTGVPFLKLSDGSASNFWEPVSPSSSASEIAYAELNMNPRMAPNIFQDRIDFWNNLTLDDHDLNQF